MKKRFATILTSAIAILSLAACDQQSEQGGVTPEEEKVIPAGKYEEFDFRGQEVLDHDYISLKHLYFNLGVGESKQIEVESLPESYAKDELSYVSNNASIASVSESGEILGVSEGVADITVFSSDKKYSDIVRVSVSKLSSLDESASVISTIQGVYNAEGYKPATKTMRYEYSEEFYSCEGVPVHGTKGYEVIAYNSETGYLYIEGPSLYYKTANGTPELLDGKWLMYPINQGLYTRLVHVTPTTKKYFDINTAAYETYDEITRDIVNFFFVSGEEIIDRLMNDYDGKEDFNEFLELSSTTVYSVDDNSLAFNYIEARDNKTVTYDEEINSFDIPAGTVYSYEYNHTFLNSHNRNTGVDIDMTMFYQLDGKDWTRSFKRSQRFEGEFEEQRIKNPKDEGYQYAESLYDL